MKREYKIGSNEDCDIIIGNDDGGDLHAVISYDKGRWNLVNLDKHLNTFINSNKVIDKTALDKYDQIQIGKTNIHWSDYLFEGENQELNLKDFKSLHGRINRPNYRALILLVIGSAICVFFIPGLAISIADYIQTRYLNGEHLDYILSIKLVAPIIYSCGYLACLLFFFLISFKRMQDTGYSKWNLLIPIYNLKILFFTPSKF